MPGRGGNNGQSIKPFKQLYSCVADPKQPKQLYLIQSTANRERVGAISFKRTSYTVGGVTAEYSCSLIVDVSWDDFKNATGTNISSSSSRKQKQQWKKFRNECGWDLVEGVMPLGYGRGNVSSSARGLLLAHKRVSTIEEFRLCNTEDNSWIDTSTNSPSSKPGGPCAILIIRQSQVDHLFVQCQSMFWLASAKDLSLCLLPPCSLQLFWLTFSNQPSSLTTYVTSSTS